MQKQFRTQLDTQSPYNLQQFQLQLKECDINIKQPIKNRSLYRSRFTKSDKKIKKYLEVRLPDTESQFIKPPINQIQIAEESNRSIIIEKSAVSSYCEPRLRGLKKKGVRLGGRKAKWLELKDVVTSQKVNKLKQIFCNKIKRNNPYTYPIEYQSVDNQYSKNFLHEKGVELKEIYQKILSLFSIYNIISSIFVFTILLIFPSVKENIALKIFEIFSSLIILTQIILNFITVKFSLGKKLQTIKQISSDYLKNKFLLDFFIFFIILTYIITQNPTIRYFRIIMIFKIPDCIDKIQKLQVYFIQNYYNQQYWSLFKVFLFNYCFAHMLAIILIAMSNINPHNNWLINKGIDTSPWYEQYIWSYYWATTIMLTIGFGDIIPSCYQEALCMIFIETISCMVLAYNINCIGSLISNIRSQDIEKSKSMKIFKKLVDKNGINEELSSKINNYIEEHTNIKKLFNIQEEAQFVQKLPTAFRNDYLKEANKIIFQKIFFFNNLLEKTLFSLAQKIQMKIAHPQEVIINKQTNFDLFILKNGQIGYFSRKTNRKYSKNIFDSMKVNQNDSPFLLNANFITKNRLNYGIKSIIYSVIYCLEYENLIQIFGLSNLDYQLYCQERDKHKKNIDEFEVFPCEHCPKVNHTKFSCPRLHFVPIQSHIKSKYLYQQRNNKNERKPNFIRMQIDRESSLSQFLINKQIYDQKKQQQQTNLFQTNKIKQQKFIINQLVINENNTNEFKQKVDPNHINIDKFTTTSNTFEALAKMQANLLQGTVQIIKTEINKSLGFKKAQDDVWLLELDRMKNYKDYFAKNNPCNLNSTFNTDQRRKKNVDDNINKALIKLFSGKIINTFNTFEQKSN